MASRKDDIKKMSNFMGNAAAHRAIYGVNAFTLLEATRYEDQADEIAKLRTWNEDEVARLIERTKREARNIIKQRQERWRDKSFDTLCTIANREIDKFVARVRERQK